MKFKIRIFNTRWKSISIYTKNKEHIIRYWGGLKFDIVTLHAGK